MRLYLTLLCVLFLCGCTSKNRADFEACLELNDSTLRDECLLNVSSASPDLEVCDRINEKKTRFKCIKNVAIAKLDAKLCDDVLDIDVNAECVTGVAVSTRNHLVCKRIDRMSKRDACEMAVGEVKRKDRRAGGN
jgi:hypothetical protein